MGTTAVGALGIAFLSLDSSASTIDREPQQFNDCYTVTVDTSETGNSAQEAVINPAIEEHFGEIHIPEDIFDESLDAAYSAGIIRDGEVWTTCIETIADTTGPTFDVTTSKND